MFCGSPHAASSNSIAEKAPPCHSRVETADRKSDRRLRIQSNPVCDPISNLQPQSQLGILRATAARGKRYAARSTSCSRYNVGVEIEMLSGDYSNDDLEASAQGRIAFWRGRPIWTNPLTGEAAREWTAGWKHALGELSSRRGGRMLSASATDNAEWHTVLALYRPDDVQAIPSNRRTVKKRVRSRAGSGARPELQFSSPR